MRSIHTRILISTLSPGRERKTKQATEVEGGLAQRLLWELPCPCNFQHYSSILSTASVSSNLPLLRILRADSVHQSTQLFNALPKHNPMKSWVVLWTEPGWEPSRDWSGEAATAAQESQRINLFSFRSCPPPLLLPLFTVFWLFRGTFDLKVCSEIIWNFIEPASVKDSLSKKKEPTFSQR